jgi:ribosome maturation factor RimP
VRETTKDLVRGLSLELVDVEITRERGRTFVRLSVDRPGGVTVDDCASTSELVAQVLDRENVLKGSYVLEVMSPGLYRPLRRPEDFARSTGKRVKVKLHAPVDGKSGYTGTIESACEDSFTISVEGGSIDLRYDDVSAARLEPELPW